MWFDGHSCCAWALTAAPTREVSLKAVKKESLSTGTFFRRSRHAAGSQVPGAAAAEVRFCSPQNLHSVVNCPATRCTCIVVFGTVHSCHEQLSFVTNYTYWNIYYTFLMYGFVCNFPSRSLLTHRTLLVAPRLLPPSYCTHCLCTRYSIDTLIK